MGAGDDDNLARLVAMTGKVAASYVNARLTAAGSNLAVAIVCRILVAEPGLSQAEVAQRAGVEAPTVTRHLDRLETAGLVRRERDSGDRRVVRVYLTAAGIRHERELARLTKAADAQLAAVFTARQLTQLCELLHRLQDHADDLLQ